LPEEYVLGHSGSELARLDLQGALYREITQRVMIDAGLTEGMSVLDIGCGSGDVTRLAGQLVGPSGSVLGVDHDEGTIPITAKSGWICDQAAAFSIIATSFSGKLCMAMIGLSVEGSFSGTS